MPAKLSKEVNKALWKRGLLRHLLTKPQQEIYDSFKAHKGGKVFVVDCSRRLGKSWLMVVLALEMGFSKRRARIQFAAPTADELEEIVFPLFNEILETCPLEMRPRYKGHKRRYEFYNGSQIKISGTEKGHYNRLRGTKADLCLIDEAGFHDCLPQLVNDVFMPQLMYSNDGKILMASTPADTPSHPFRDYCMKARETGGYEHRTIFDNVMVTHETILEFAKEAGCEVDWDNQKIVRESTTWKREYLAEHVTEEDRAIIPEFTVHKQKKIIRDWEMPPFALKTTVIDTGFIDYTACVFGYYDFKAGKLVVQDDLLINFRKEGMTVELFCRMVLDKEKELWGEERPYQRWADGDLIVLNELQQYNLPTTPVAKDNIEAQINQLRLDVQNEVLYISPKAVNVISHMYYGVWNKSRIRFDRTPGHGHFDALAAMIYFARHVDRVTNPYPAMYGITDTHNKYIPDGARGSSHQLRKIFKQ